MATRSHVALASMLLWAGLEAAAVGSSPVVMPPGAVNVPKWFTWYDADPFNQKNRSNLVWDRDLLMLDGAYKNYSIKGMWSIVGGTCRPGQAIFGEPYCGGAHGLTENWRGAASWVAGQVANRPHIVGLWLGDEPEVLGVPGTMMCQLAEYLKSALINASRGDVFLYYNDGPGSYQISNGLCKGLDYFSLDSYSDDPAQEVRNVQVAMSKIAASGNPLHAPNPYESQGQGIFVVPGIFWFMSACADGGSLGPIDPYARVPPPHGCNMTLGILTGKMKAFWDYALATKGIVGINPWHWSDRPTLSPPSMTRGGVSMLGGTESTDGSLAQWIGWIGGNISAAYPEHVPKGSYANLK